MIDAGAGARALVERRKLAQWFFKITEYTEELLDASSTPIVGSRCG